jgi:nucleotide-binding universal stress UspA family protein
LKRILVPIDFSQVTNTVIKAAIGQAQAFGAMINLVHVAEPEPDFVGFKPGPDSVRKSQVKKVCDFRHELYVYKEQLEKAGIKTKALMIQGPTVEKILQEATRWKADQIIIGSHGHGKLYKLLLGSTSAAVVKKASCPVLIISSQRAKK